MHRRKAPTPGEETSQPSADAPVQRGKKTGAGLAWKLLCVAILGGAATAYYYFRLPKEYVTRAYAPNLLHTSASLEEARARYASDPSSPLFLSVLGHVFDVSNGESFYGEGRRYHVFAFRDASRALATNDYKSQEAMTDDLTELTKSQCGRVHSWLQFFLKKRRKYFYAGRMVGAFFDSQGQPTEALAGFEACAGVSNVMDLVRQLEATGGAPAAREERLFTREELKELGEARDRDGGGTILLSILGNVFDVTAGETFYAKGEGYGFFSYTDGSRAYVTGDFTEEGVTDDVSGLSNEQCEGVYRWLTFYEDKDEYPYVGKLIGRFYDDQGHITQALKDFRQCASLDDNGKPIPKPEGELPSVTCNTRWSKGQGTTLWCDDEDQVPRLLARKEKKRCYCIDVRLAHTNPDEYLAYDGCDPYSNTCRLPD